MPEQIINKLREAEVVWSRGEMAGEAGQEGRGQMWLLQAGGIGLQPLVTDRGGLSLTSAM